MIIRKLKFRSHYLLVDEKKNSIKFSSKAVINLTPHLTEGPKNSMGNLGLLSNEIGVKPKLGKSVDNPVKDE